MKLILSLIIVCWTSILLEGCPVYSVENSAYPEHGAHYIVRYGVASWYGDKEQGRAMASGQPFDEYAMIAAERTLPFGTAVSVTNLRNGRSVVVRIMDRGPHVAGRAIDLSKAAAEQLRFTHQGLTPVKMRVLNTPKSQMREAELPRGPSRKSHITVPTAQSRPLRVVAER